MNRQGGFEPSDERSGDIAHGALVDVAAWLGFGETRDYLMRLPVERERIFARAMD